MEPVGSSHALCMAIIAGGSLCLAFKFPDFVISVKRFFYAFLLVFCACANKVRLPHIGA
jgi:hypothetical protein